MYKIGTVAEAEKMDGKIPDNLFAEVVRIVTMLDETFGAERDVDDDDGGFVFIVENLGDLNYFVTNYVELDSPLLEYVEPIDGDGAPYLNAFFLYNEYAFGITLLLPLNLAPAHLIKESTKD